MKFRNLIILLFFVIFLAGCSETEKELPAVKVVFTHYLAGKDHFVKINEVEPVLVKRDEVKSLYENPPFPGIHVFAYVFGENNRISTPVTYVPIDREGENITVYIGFRSPKEVPNKGDMLLVVVDVIEKVNGKYKSVALDQKRIVWNLEWEE